MLQLINYDLPDHKYDELEKGVEHAGGGIHMLNGPWIYGANKSPREVLMTVVRSLKASDGEKTEKDKLLVFPVQMGEISNGRDLDPMEIERHDGDKVMAVAYTLRNPKGGDEVSEAADKVADEAERAAKKAASDEHRQRIIDALNELGTTCHPLEALWLVKTDLSAHEVHLAIEKAVPLNPKDELMVAEVDLKAVMNGCSVKGAEEGLDPLDHNWLVEAGVL